MTALVALALVALAYRTVTVWIGTALAKQWVGSELPPVARYQLPVATSD